MDSKFNHDGNGYKNCQNVFENIPLFIKKKLAATPLEASRGLVGGEKFDLIPF